MNKKLSGSPPLFFPSFLRRRGRFSSLLFACVMTSELLSLSSLIYNGRWREGKECFFLLLFVWSKKNLCSGLSSGRRGSREQRGEPPGSKEFGNVFLSNERVERRKEFG